MRNIPTKNIGDKFFHYECNDITSEEKNLITSAGIVLSEFDLNQVAKAVANYVASGDFYTDTGTPNNYVLQFISMLVPTAYVDGFRVRFRATNTNTGTSQVDVGGLGNKPIKKEDGLTNISAGDIPAGEVTELVYNAAQVCFELYSHRYEKQVFETGDDIWTSRTGDRPGWIWINDSSKTTIGDASSSATIRANADCEQLFKIYWNNFLDSECPVGGGRGGSANADWTAHKRITIPNMYARVFAAHNVMDVLRIGQTEGVKTYALTLTENAQHNHSIYDAHHAHGNGGATEITASRDTGGTHNTHAGGRINTTTSDAGISTYNSGTGDPHQNMQPTIYQNLYIKL